MAEKAPSSCPVCSEPFNDNLRLPLTTSCGHTTCTACLRTLTLDTHPDAAPGREGTVPSGKEVECQQCHKEVSTDQLVINRAVLAKVPVSLDDLIIPEDTPKKDPHTKHDPDATLATTDQHEQTTTTVQQSPLQHTGETQLGWTRPKMDPHHNPHHQHPPQQPGVIGWTTSPQYPQGHPGHHQHPPPPQSMPLPPHGYPHQTQYPHPQHHGHPHGHDHGHHHGHQSHVPVAPAASAVGATAGVAGLSLHHKKKKKDKKKHHKKERKHRSSSRSSGSSRSSRSSSRSSRSSNSS